MNSTNTSFPLLRPDLLLRVEGGLQLAIACIAYGHFFPQQWGLFALFFLAPDLSLLAFASKQGAISAAVYNLAHTEALPLLLGLAAFETHHPFGGKLTLIWMAHISFDRLLGYGLKFASSFRYTHVQSAREWARTP
jgi:hypothetical protein